MGRILDLRQTGAGIDGRFLKAADNLADLLASIIGAPCQVLYFIGYYRKAAALFANPGGLYGKQIGLFGDVLNAADNRPDV